ncbi:hypothetical protein LCGC14_0194740 [marine sediment metagenome]|uniref:Uncharacterized protein n=1 Tax=marine sediment metagenome TaxID=412755 RepID=A0A0F9V1P2_9ZZZZ
MVEENPNQNLEPASEAEEAEEQDYTAIDIWQIINDFAKSNNMNFEHWAHINKKLLVLHTAVEKPLSKALHKLAAMPIIMDFHTINKLNKKINSLEDYAAGIDFFIDNPQRKGILDMDNDAISIILKMARQELKSAKAKILEK